MSGSPDDERNSFASATPTLPSEGDATTFQDGHDPHPSHGAVGRRSSVPLLSQIQDPRHERSKTDGGVTGSTRYGPMASHDQAGGQNREQRRHTIHRSASTPLSDLGPLGPSGKPPVDPLAVYKTTAVIELGDLPEEDGFVPLEGKPGNIKCPGTWRPGFEPPWDPLSSSSSFLPASVNRGEDFPGGPYRRRKLSEEVRKRWIKAGPVTLDVRYPPSALQNTLSPAISDPPLPWVRLHHPALPWFIDVLQTSPRGITVFDVMRQMHEQLMTPLTEGDVWNEYMTDDMRRNIVRAYRERCGDDPPKLRSDSPHLDPVRLDFLGSCCAFEGLKDNWSGKACYRIAFRDWRI